MKTVRIGSRGSKLALWQAEYLAKALAAVGIKTEIVVIKTSGDRFASSPVSSLSDSIGGKGIFIKEIEEALVDRRIDLAIHSMKDVPSEICADCHVLVAFEREDPRDCLVSYNGATLSQLPSHARVGTSSVRRASQLRRLRPDFEIFALRGNVDTRLRRLDAGEFDAIVLAKAGIERLGLASRITQVLSAEQMLPAIGQGALGVEFLATSEGNYAASLQKLEHRETSLSVACERALQRELQGGCTIPLGAWARHENGGLRMDACVLSADGSEVVRRSAIAECESHADAETLGRRLAREMLEAGAGRLLQLAGRSVSGA